MAGSYLFRNIKMSWIFVNFVIPRSKREINNRNIKNHDQSIKKDDTKIKELLRDYKADLVFAVSESNYVLKVTV